jgi:hypothetical protein
VRLGGLSVNVPLLSRTPKSYLTLSAAPKVDRAPEGTRSVIVEDHGYALISVGGPVPHEAIVRDERDPITYELEGERTRLTESELRALWGDR